MVVFNDVMDNNFLILGEIIVDHEVWNHHSNLFAHLPMDNLIEAPDKDEGNFEIGSYFGRCEGSVDTITFAGGIWGFYFTGTYVADYMQVVLKE